IAEPPPPPTLSVQPKHQEYFEGEAIRFICSAYRNMTVFQNLTVQGYRFFREDGRQIFETAPNAYRQGIMDLRAQMNDTGSYSCAYWLEEASQEVQLAQSLATRIQVKEAPSAPSLSVNSTSFHLGDSISLKCSAPPETNKITQFHLTGEKMGILVVYTHKSIYSYNLTIKEDKDVGNFRCAYSQLLSGRNVLSRSSKPIFIDGLGVRWVRMLAVGGSFFTMNGLIFLISHCLSLKYRSPLQTTERTI
ncbi:immunoglobulin superfamily member 1-like, partial [Python bivittatus]|uniref:immunoglobulin superfamily member 1-like n=1 Tax=Python bivittatus TaxID=176946 RepID=UPI000D6A536A